MLFGIRAYCLQLGYPLLLAASDLFFPDSASAKKWASFLLVSFGLLAFSSLCLKYLRKFYWFPPLALVFTPFVLEALNQIRVDYAFMGLCLLSFWAYDKLSDLKQVGRVTPFWYFLGVFSLFLPALSFRPNGLFILFAVLGAEALRLFRKNPQDRLRELQPVSSIILAALSCLFIVIIWTRILPLNGTLPLGRQDSFSPKNIYTMAHFTLKILAMSTLVSRDF